MEIIDKTQSLKDNPKVKWTDFNAERKFSDIKMIVVHHTADHINDLDRINEIEIEGSRIYKEGCQRMPYHFWISENSKGKIYQCNKLGWVTWHATNANLRSIGVALVGDYTKKLPDAYTLGLLKELLDHLTAILNLDRTKVFGHGELTAFGNYTNCPGNCLQAWIKNYRKGVIK